MTSHLCVGDPHASPDYDNKRFDILGKFILDRKPDVIICMGDFNDMNSLSSYDKGKKCYEGRRVIKDIEAGIDANERMWGPVNEFNLRRRKNGDKQYKPRKIMLYGNHDEARINRAIESDPQLDGLISVDNLQYKKYWSELIAYKIPILVDGVNYCHHFPTGVSGQPISGQYLARALLSKNFQSSTVGHSHLLDYHMDTRADGSRIHGLSAGCFVDFVAEYALDTAKLWWTGLVFKHDVLNGDYSPEFISMKTLKGRYA